MTPTKRELEAKLFNLHFEMQKLIRSWEILSEGINKVIEISLDENNERKTKLSDVAFVAMVMSNKELGIKQLPEVLAEVERAKDRIEKDRY